MKWRSKTDQFTFENGDTQQSYQVKQYGNNEPLFYLRRGILKIQLGDYRGAIHDCSLVIERNPQNAEAWYWRGMAKHEARQMPCHDLNRARNLGYQPAQEALMKYCNKDQ